MNNFPIEHLYWSDPIQLKTGLFFAKSDPECVNNGKILHGDNVIQIVSISKQCLLYNIKSDSYSLGYFKRIEEIDQEGNTALIILFITNSTEYCAFEEKKGISHITMEDFKWVLLK